MKITASIFTITVASSFTFSYFWASYYKTIAPYISRQKSGSRIDS